MLGPPEGSIPEGWPWGIKFHEVRTTSSFLRTMHPQKYSHEKWIWISERKNYMTQLQWFMDGSLILDNKEKIGTARPITTPDGLATGWEFVPVKNNTLAITKPRYIELRHAITAKVNKIRNLDMDSKAMRDTVEIVRKVSL